MTTTVKSRYQETLPHCLNVKGDVVTLRVGMLVMMDQTATILLMPKEGHSASSLFPHIHHIVGDLLDGLTEVGHIKDWEKVEWFVSDTIGYQTTGFYRLSIDYDTEDMRFFIGNTECAMMKDVPTLETLMY